MSILRRFKGKLYSLLYSCEEFNIANRLARKIKRRLNFILQLFLSALKTRFTVVQTASILALSESYWIVFDISSQMVYNGYRNVV